MGSGTAGVLPGKEAVFGKPHQAPGPALPPCALTLTPAVLQISRGYSYVPGIHTFIQKRNTSEN